MSHAFSTRGAMRPSFSSKGWIPPAFTSSIKRGGMGRPLSMYDYMPSNR